MFNKFFLLLLLLISVGVFVMVIDPTYKGNQLLIADREKLGEALDKARELKKVRDQLEERAGSISSDDLERLHRLLPDSVKNVRLVLDIDQIANRYGLTITELQFDKNQQKVVEKVVETQQGAYAKKVVVRDDTRVGPESDSPLQSLSLEFTVSSSYGQFLNFLKDLEKSLRLVDIVGISFTAETTDLYDFKVKIATYWLRNKI